MLATESISPRLFGGARIVNRPDLENARLIDRMIKPIVLCMEHTGMRIDRNHIIKLHERLTGEMEELQVKVGQLTGYNINIGSGDQLADLLFSADKLRLKQPGKAKWTKSKKRLAVDSDVLKAMISQHPAIKPMLDWKEREKLRSTYTLSLGAKADDNDRIHTDISTTSTETWRLASSDPNLQNIPTRTKLGREVRNAFIPKDGNVMGTVDASQIEMRQHAHDSQCGNMMEIFWSWDDLYWATAELMNERVFTPDERKHGMVEELGISYKDWYRFNAKTTTLGVSYDISPEGLVDQFLVSGAITFLTGGEKEWNPDKHLERATRKCAQTIMSWFEAYPEILQRRKEHHRRALRYGLVWDMFGHIRWIPQVRSVHHWVTAEGLRQAGNKPIQGAAAGIIKLWMAALWHGWYPFCHSIQHYWMPRGLHILMQIHDELLVEGPRQVVVDWLEEAKWTLRNLLPLSHFTVPLEASGVAGELGEPWGALEK